MACNLIQRDQYYVEEKATEATIIQIIDTLYSVVVKILNHDALKVNTIALLLLEAKRLDGTWIEKIMQMDEDCTLATEMWIGEEECLLAYPPHFADIAPLLALPYKATKKGDQDAE